MWKLHRPVRIHYVSRVCIARYSSIAQSFKCLTVINSTKTLDVHINDHLEKLHHFKALSVIIACTPAHVNELYNLINSKDIGGHLRPLQRIAFVVDSVPFGAQRKAFSCLFFNDRVGIHDPVPLGAPESMAGVDPTNLAGESVRGNQMGRNTWKSSNSYISISYEPNGDIIFPAANTIFSSGTESVILHNTRDRATFPGMLLSSVKLGLPSDVKLQIVAALAPLKQIGDGDLKVTASVNNMIKTINGRPAASFLESVSEIMDPAEFDANVPRKVFAEVKGSKFSVTSRYEVVAGGGGTWSPRSSMLVLEPQATVSKGDSILFHLAMPLKGPESYEKYGLKQQARALESSDTSKVVLECTPMSESTNEPDLIEYSPDTIIPDSFGIGTENGFLINDIKHSVNGELVVLESE